jgi:D-3-phosphoglycerate dehydrogenase / 2-oxoglutarate reductase
MPTIHKAVEAGKKQFAGIELPGRTLGVIGLGAIGVKVANAAIALGMKVIGYRSGDHRGRRLALRRRSAGESVDDLLRRRFRHPARAADRRHPQHDQRPAHR